MTDQEARYRCPGCGNEERGDLLASFAAVYGAPDVHNNHKPMCPTSNCVVRLHEYQLIEEPEPEEAREWGYSHRFPGGNWPAACGHRGDERSPHPHPYIGELHREASHTPCPDCLPKPVEGEPEAFHRCEAFSTLEGVKLQCNKDFGHEGDHLNAPRYDLCPDPLPPPRAEWVPEEYEHDSTYLAYLKRVMASLAEHVNAMLARPGEGGEQRPLSIEELNKAAGLNPSGDLNDLIQQEIRILSGDNVFAQAAANDRARKDAAEKPEVPWTRVEDGLPGDDDLEGKGE